MDAQAKRQRDEFKESDDLEDDFRLPITHRPTENLDTDNLEQASEDTELTSSNIGFRLLQKMGWKGKGLGKDEQGMIEPIRAKSRDAKLGLGKQEQDDYYTSEENVHRKKLGVELEETEELMRRREVEAEREQKIQTEVKEIRKVFFCELCNKQYKLAMEFETHLSSYDHNHKKRFKEMRELQTSRGKDDRQKREQLRHEKELQRFAQLAEAQRQQQQEQQASLPVASVPESEAANVCKALPQQEQRTTLKFGFAAKPPAAKMLNSAVKRSKLVGTVAAVFQDESDDEK